MEHIRRMEWRLSMGLLPLMVLSLACAMWRGQVHPVTYSCALLIVALCRAIFALWYAEGCVENEDAS